MKLAVVPNVTLRPSSDTLTFQIVLPSLPTEMTAATSST